MVLIVVADHEQDLVSLSKESYRINSQDYLNANPKNRKHTLQCSSLSFSRNKPMMIVNVFALNVVIHLNELSYLDFAPLTVVVCLAAMKLVARAY